MTLTRRMAQAPTKLYNKLSFNDVDPMTAIYTFYVIHFHINPLDPTEISENPSEILGKSPFFCHIWVHLVFSQ